jgi:hypothetical protein
MACSLCDDICTCGPRSASRAAVAEDPSQLWPATDAAWQDSAWRKEITSRVRAHKRKRGVDDDTLSLGFEEPELTPEEQVSGIVSEPDVNERPLPPPPSRYQRIAMKRAQAQYETGNLIMFPPPEPTISDPVQEALAEPMPQTPRILEAAFEQVAPPDSVLFSGIHLDAAVTAEEPYFVPDLELPLQVAPISVQVVSWLVDSAFALGGFAAFGIVVMKMTGISAAGKSGVAIAFGFAAAFWIAYHAMFLIYAGFTPGMNFAGLGLCTFDDDRPSRLTCAKRTVALVLSLISLGMGFIWASLDEDGLGWHDRISRTYLRPL